MAKCSGCGAEFEGKFCPECGTPRSSQKVCPSCGAACEASARFCTECGNPLGDEQRKQASPQPFGAPRDILPAVRIGVRVCRLASVLLLGVFSLLLFALYAASFAELDVLFGKGSVGNPYKDFVANMPELKAEMIALWIFTVLAVAFATASLLCTFLPKFKHKEAKLAGKYSPLGSTISLLGFVPYIALVTIVSVMMARIKSLDEGMGMLTVGAGLVLVLVFTLVFMLLHAAATVVTYVLKRKCPAFVAEEDAARLVRREAEERRRARFFSTHAAPVMPEMYADGSRKARRLHKKAACFYKHNTRRYNKAKEGSVSASVVWLDMHKVSLCVAAVLLAAAIALLCILIPFFTNIFRIAKVQKIRIGDTPARVEKVLGRPYAGTKTDTVWEYFDDDYSDLIRQLEKISQKQEQAMEKGDLQALEQLTLQGEQLQEKMLAETYRYICVCFDAAQENGETVYRVKSVLFDNRRNDSAAEKKEVKSVHADIPDDVPIGYYIDESTGEARGIEYRDNSALSYHLKFADGGYYRAKADYTVAYKTEKRPRLRWSDPYGKHHAVDADGAIIKIGEVSADGAWTTDLNNKEKIVKLQLPDSVTSIGSSAFEGCSSLTSITIPDGVTSIGDSTFEDCNKLASVHIGKNVQSIENNAFAKCPITDFEIDPQNSYLSAKDNVLYDKEQTKILALIGEVVSVTIPNTVTSIGSAFMGCESLQSIVFEQNSKLTSIGESAFRGCISLTSITIPDSVTSIGDSALYDCSKLTSITIPDSVTSIGSYAFKDCSNLASIHIGINVQTIENNAFANCPITDFVIDPQNSYFSVKDNVLYDKEQTKILALIGEVVSVTIPNTVTSIGSAFQDCESLQSIIFEQNSKLMSIEDRAFSGCISLTSITIPDSVTSIGDSAFRGCSNLVDVHIGKSVQSIGNGAFKDCSGLTSVSIPDSVASIGNSTFSGCSNLVDVHIGKSVQSIGNDAFEDCSGLTSVTIPDSVTSIGGSAFEDCNKLASVHIGKNVQSIENNAFANCPITDFEIDPQNSYFSVKDNVLYNKEHTKILTLIGEVVSVTIPNTVTSIGLAFKDCESLQSVIFEANSKLTSIEDSALSGCSSLTSITIPDSVTSIGGGAFRGCSNLTSITIPFVGEEMGTTTNTHFGYIFGAGSYSDNSSHVPASLKTVIITGGTSIGDEAFYGCSGLTSITIPDSVTSIGEGAFSGCSSLTSITIPDSVTSIGEWAFSGCSSLTSITIPDSVTRIGRYAFSGCSGLTSITIPDSVTSIGEGAFYNCSGLTSITIPDSVISIGDSVFRDCSSLTSVTVPDSVTSIGDSVFRDCSGLTSITIPDSVTSIGEWAFSGCSSLTSITIPNSVTSIGDRAFRDCSSLTSITIPDSVTSIGEWAFSGCSSLTSITIPDSVTSIGWYAFFGCSSLTIYCEAESKPRGWARNWNDDNCPVVWGYKG